MFDSTTFKTLIILIQLNSQTLFYSIIYYHYLQPLLSISLNLTFIVVITMSSQLYISALCRHTFLIIPSYPTAIKIKNIIKTIEKLIYKLNAYILELIMHTWVNAWVAPPLTLFENKGWRKGGGTIWVEQVIGGKAVNWTSLL